MANISLRKFLKFVFSIVFLLCILFLNKTSFAQEKPARILFLVDASGSMAHPWLKTETRFQTASRLISGIVDSINNINQDVSFAVRVFGAEYPAIEENCFDTKLEVPFRLQNQTQIKARLNDIRPKGFSPIAFALKETAEKDFIQSDLYAYSIILITDGGESCEGDICATMQQLLAKKISFKPYILSLIDYEPLRDLYECMGNYLTITQESEIKPAIKKIIDDNRKILSVKSSGIKKIANTPSQIGRSNTPPIRTTPMESIIPSVEPEITLVPEMTVPKTENQVPEKLSYNKMPVFLKPSKMGILFALPDLNKIKVPLLPQVRFEIEEEPTQPIVFQTPTEKEPPAKPAVAKPKEPVVIPTSEFRTEVADAEETGLQIYFTDGSGKYYNTQPRINILESSSKKTVKSTFRTISGEQPEIIKIDPGTYDIIIPNSEAKALNISLIPNKNNKIYIKAGRGSIAFMHPTAPERPVENYRALISKRFVKGSPVINQLCTEELPYEPANYHVEINTLPPLIYNVEVSFSEIKVLAIPEPGTIEITNTSNFNEVQFWYQLGDRYVPFYEMKVTGNTASQKADFLPGRYQVRYYKQPERPNQKAEIISFQISKNETTKITLAN